MNLHYSEAYTDMTYNDVLVRACAENGIAAFTGDGTNPTVMEMATKAIGAAGGCGVPTIKPWNIDTIKEKDGAGQGQRLLCRGHGRGRRRSALPEEHDSSCRQQERGRACRDRQAGRAALYRQGRYDGQRCTKKAKEAGAAAIVVSNHGGRVLDQCPATAEVLPEIAAALKGTGVKVLVDGGIRTGVDVFKALALGADGVLICRPFVTAVYGGGEEGVKCYIDKLAGELADTMQMCGAHSLAEITPDMVRV